MSNNIETLQPPTIRESYGKDEYWAKPYGNTLRGISKVVDEMLQHPTLLSWEDVISYTKANPTEKIYGVYFRTMMGRDEISNKIILKITIDGHGKVGKGYIINGVLTRDASAAGSPDVLETLYFIPCKDESSAYTFEGKFHDHLKQLDRYKEPYKNSDGHTSGTEWFDKWPKDKKEAIEEFIAIGKQLLDIDNIGLTTFKYTGDTQEKLVNDVIAVLRQKKKALFAGYPGFGKTILSPKFITEICVPGDVVLFTTPILDTMNDFKDKCKEIYYGDIKIKVIDSNTIKKSSDIISDINDYQNDGYIVIICSSVHDLRHKDKGKVGKKLRKKYQFLLKLQPEIKMWIRDEYHTEYNGVITSKLFKQLKSTYTLDLTASTVKLLSLYSNSYTKEMIVRYDLHDMLYEKNVKNNPEFKNRPNYKMEAIDFDSNFLSPDIKKLFTTEEGVTSKKLCKTDDDGNLATPNEMTEYLKLRLDNECMNSDRTGFIPLGDKNPYYLGSKYNATLMVVPHGNAKHTTTDIQKKIKELGNNRIRNRKFYTADDFIDEVKLGLNGTQILEKWLGHAKRNGRTDGIVLLTHQQLTTGSNMPPLNSMLILDVIGSIDRFMQLIGRLSREYKDKKDVKVCLDVPGMSLSVSSMMYKTVVDKTPDKKLQRELLACVPHVMYMNDKPIDISFEDHIGNFNKDINRRLEGFHVSPTLISKFPDVVAILEKCKIKGYLKPSSIPELELTKDIGSKTTKPNSKGIDSTSTKKSNIRKKIETLAVMLTESLSIYICEGHETAKSIFTSSDGLAVKFFSSDDIKLILSTLETVEFHKTVSDWYKDIKETYEDMSTSEIIKSEQLFINSDFKKRQGLVYIPKTVSNEMIDYIASDNSEPESILVVNALNGMLPVLLRDRFPNTRIVCVEYFSYYINHLTDMGFETYKLTMNKKGIISIPELGNNMNFDYGITNPPYTKGAKLLYTYFFKELLNRVDKLLQLMPVELKSTHDKLKFHNKRIHKHQIFMSENVSDHFNVGYNNLRYVVASKNVENEIPDIENLLDNLSLLYPERKRLKFIGGDTVCGETEEDTTGTNVVYKLLQNDNLIIKKIPSYKVLKSKKWTTSKYSVFVNVTPSLGKFNCSIVKGCKMTWSRKVFMVECDNKNDAVNLKKWLRSDEITKEILNMLKIKNDTYSVSLEMVNRLPHYE